jgi:hypothetical protein
MMFARRWLKAFKCWWFSGRWVCRREVGRGRCPDCEKFSDSDLRSPVGNVNIMDMSGTDSDLDGVAACMADILTAQRMAVEHLADGALHARTEARTGLVAMVQIAQDGLRLESAPEDKVWFEAKLKKAKRKIDELDALRFD